MEKQEYKRYKLKIIDHLSEKKLNYNDYYISNVEKKVNELYFPLYHKSAFKVKYMLGNPGGKCRMIIINIDSNRVVFSVLWK